VDKPRQHKRQRPVGKSLD